MKKIHRLSFLAALLLAAPLAASEPIVCAPADAAAQLGKYATVTGQVSEVHLTPKGNIMFHFGGRYPKQMFSAVIFPSDREKFEGIDLEAMEGKTISVTGTVRLYQKKPEIILKRRDQLKVPANTAGRG